MTVTPLREINPANDRCQRWNQGHHSWTRRSAGGFDSESYTVEKIDEPTARTYIETHHYSHSYVADKHRFALMHHGPDGSTLVGVAVFGIPTSKKVLTNPLPDLIPYVESLELSRLVLSDGPLAPGNSESWFVAQCLAEMAPLGVRGIVSFADPVPRVVAGRVLFPGHIGTIYQASNAVFAGRATARTLLLLPDGTSLNDRSIQKVRRQERGHEYVERRLVEFGARVPQAGVDMNSWLADALDAIGITRLRHGGNYRYILAVGGKRERARLRIATAPLPYPKLLAA